jgi:hypothetical protein
MKVQQVSVNPIDEDLSGGLSEQVVCSCTFCGKSSKYPSVSRGMCEKLSRERDFFCHFCLRSGHFARSARHTLILSFRGIIGWYYYLGYKKTANYKRSLYLSEINEYIKEHAHAGLMNPLFRYDDESLLWFIDFEKVGTAKRKLPLEAIKQTAVSVLASFNLWEHIPGVRLHKLAEKYTEAIDVFYTHRTRPPERRILSPTLAGCGVVEAKECPFEKTREFSRALMVP